MTRPRPHLRTIKLETAGLVIVPLMLAPLATGQPLQNLHFDAAHPAAMSTSVADALPGWNAYVGGIQFDAAFYNTIPLDASYVGVFDENAPSYMPKPLCDEGYGAVLAAGLGGDVSISQIGTVPDGSSFISFWTTGPTGYTAGEHDDSVRFSIMREDMAVPSRQDTALFVIERSGEWTRWSADISAYAGTIAEIRFSLGSYYVPGKSGAYEMYLDGINITSFPVPEPGLILFTVGCAAFLVPVRMKHLSDSRGSRRGRQNACFGYP